MDITLPKPLGLYGVVAFCMADLGKVLGFGLWLTAVAGLGQQVNDPHFTSRVEHPAFSKKHPRLAIDASHRNFHTLEDRYKPFAALMESDGFAVSVAPPFTVTALSAIDVLVIANAMGDPLAGNPGAVRSGAMGPAFTTAECDAVRDWVRRGGSLLLIADHAPWGDASAILAQQFGVEMGLGIVMDSKHADGNPTRLV